MWKIVGAVMGYWLLGPLGLLLGLLVGHGVDNAKRFVGFQTNTSRASL